MRRVVLRIAAMALLFGLAPVTTAGCNFCPCIHTPDPNWTPEPISAPVAANDAAKVAGVPDMTAVLTAGAGGRQFYRATAPNTVAFVDALSGIVVEVVLLDRMPSGATVSAAPELADTAARTFMLRTGLDTQGLAVSVQQVRKAGVAAYDVEWAQLGTGGGPKSAVYVNASTGAVFAYLDLRMQLSVTAPLVGRTRATELAISALGVPGEQVTSADLAIDFATGALVRVDAVTGDATIVKS